MIELVAVLTTLGVLLKSSQNLWQQQTREVAIVTSRIDHNSYIVLNRSDKQEAADQLAKLRQHLDRLVQHLRGHPDFGHDARVIRLVQRYRPGQISENAWNQQHTSYSLNKGEKIVMCVRQRTPDQRLVDLNTLTFVGLHELAHVMSRSEGHTPEFWDNLSFLSAQAIELGIYQYQAFHQKPVEYCGVKITDTPLKPSLTGVTPIYKHNGIGGRAQVGPGGPDLSLDPRPRPSI
jgi:hypothetical protein